MIYLVACFGDFNEGKLLPGYLQEQPVGIFRVSESAMPDLTTLEKPASFKADSLLSGIAKTVNLSASLLQGIIYNFNSTEQHAKALSEHLAKESGDLFSLLQHASSKALAEMLSRAVGTSIKVG